jgi:hypothetical protein
MRKLKSIFLLIILVGIFSCSKKKIIDDVTFDSSFLGARLDSVVNLGNNKYMAYILPAFEPVNTSPWYAFSVSAKSDKEIEIKLNYGNYKHRYIPKLSTDRILWKKIEESKIKIDTTTGIATLNLSISLQKLYVAAQEIESSEDTYLWMDNILKKNSELKKVVAGKTVLKKDNYVIELEKENIKNAIIIVARQHPPEIPGGTFGFKAFFEELMANTEIAEQFRKRFNIYTFPLLNPDGADMGNWRHNAKGIDLNRDWIDFTQPETQMVKTYLMNKVKDGKKIQFALDFHTSHSGPYMLVLDSINELNTKGIIPNWIQNIETNSKFKVEARRRSQELPYCYNWFFNALGSEAVTYEDGDEIDRTIITKKAKIYAQQLMKTMITKNDNNE